jgi:tRNA-splicing ligase RtcB
MSNYELFQGDLVPVKAWVRGVFLEDKAKAQLLNLTKMPFVYKWVAAMPDVHWGMGATVGSVIATKGAIIPAAVGVDIGCGMAAVRTSLTSHDLPETLSGVRLAIEQSVPHGRTNNGGPNDVGAWQEIPHNVEDSWEQLSADYNLITAKHPKLNRGNSANHLGTLGTGNHFIEMCLDEVDRVWVMLHSGSRGVGNRIGVYFIEKAKEDMRRWYINLPDADLAYIPQGSDLFDDYWLALDWAQRFAKCNREIMLSHTLNALRDSLGRDFALDSEAVNCHHNYVSWENHMGQNVMVTRKGAVRARKDDLGIIPGSMGAKSFIVRGKGNVESFHSCSHGAGRKMSRGEAKRTFTVADHEAATIGVECRKDEDVIDETPMAYKSIDDVMNAQSDLVDIGTR